MKMNYGATFKRLREDKGLKIVDLEQPSISRSLIGKFEKGQTRISADRLDKLLSDMGVSHDEFLFLGGETNNNYIYMLLREMGVQSGKPQEKKQLEAMILKATNDMRQGRGGISARFIRDFGLMIQGALAEEGNLQIYDIDIVKKHVKPAVNFLKQAETWGQIELDIFTLFYFGMSPSDLLILSRLAIKRAKFYTQLRTEKKRLVDIAYTAFNGLLFVDLKGAAEMLTLSEQILSDADQFILDWTGERIRLKFGKGLLMMMQGSVEEGYQLAYSVLTVYEITDQKDKVKYSKEVIEKTRDAVLSGETQKIPRTYSMLL